MAIKKMWTILTGNGEVKTRRKGGAGSLYKTKGIAQNHATKDGDSVVEVSIDLDNYPHFIRARKQTTKGA